MEEHEEFPLVIHNRGVRLSYRSWTRSLQNDGGVRERHFLFVDDLPHEATKEDVLEALGNLGNVVTNKIGALLRRSGRVN